MGHRFLEIATTPDVEAAQVARGSRAAYARMQQGPASHDRLGEPEAAFIAARDSFYMATVSATGWPYIQHRGGPAGFLKVLDERTLGFADFRGNRQYITLGNAAGNDRVALFLMDYPNRRRLKLLGRLAAIDPERSPEPLERLAVPGYPARVEGGFTIAVEAFDWNCPQHITPRFTPAELTPVLDRIAALEEENRALRERLAGADASGDGA
jgi:predicted pyridoxine 5'-phosphate oxidase superfamily flavin-nucleotide-binding protein